MFKLKYNAIYDNEIFLFTRIRCENIKKLG